MAKNHADSKNQSDQRQLDNHANQLNPNNDAYWKVRGYDKKPDDRNIAKKPDDRNIAPSKGKKNSDR